MNTPNNDPEALNNLVLSLLHIRTSLAEAADQFHFIAQLINDLTVQLGHKPNDPTP